MLTYSGGKSLSLSERTRRGSTRWEACAAEGQGGRSPAPVRKPVVGVAGGAFGLVRHLEEPLSRAVAAGVLEQQQPALLPCVAAAVARGCSSAEQSLGSAEGLEPSAPLGTLDPSSRSLQNEAERWCVESSPPATARAPRRSRTPTLICARVTRPRLKRWGHRGGRVGTAWHLRSAPRGLLLLTDSSRCFVGLFRARQQAAWCGVRPLNILSSSTF